MLCIASADARFKRINPAFQRTLGYSETDLLSRSFLEFIHPDDRDSTMNEVSQLSSEIPTVHFENRFRHADNSYRWLLWNTTPAVDDGQLYASAIDITKRKHADEKYRSLQEEIAQRFEDDERRLQAMANRLVLAEENERRRIARGLHDDVGQTLLAAKMMIEELKDVLSGETQSLAQDSEQLLDHAIHSTRSLSFDLASEALYDVGLCAALQSLCKRAQQQTGIQFEPPKGLKGNPIPESARVILYRVGRELIQNIVRHSGARTARLSIDLKNQHVRLDVQDDGCGFDVAQQRQSWDERTGFGLFSIEQQLRPIGGTFEIKSSADGGTWAKVILPLNSEGATI